MRSKTALVRIVTLAMAAGTLTACRDVGLSFNIPREEAENRQFRYSVYQALEGAGPTSNPVSFDDRSWLASAELVRVPDRLMQAVGSAGGVELFAPTWSSAPHARLYTRAADGRWHPLTPVVTGDGGHGGAPAGSPGHG